MIGCKGKWTVDAFEGEFCFGLVETCADEESYGGIVVGLLHETVDGIDIEVELAGKFRFEGLGLKFYYHIAAKADMIEEEINTTIFAGDEYLFLPANKGEAVA